MTEYFEERARAWLKGLFGDTNEKRLKALRGYVERANSLEAEMISLSDDALKGKTVEFRNKIDNALKDVPDVKLIPDDQPKMPGQMRNKKDVALAAILEQILPDAFAVCREAGKRVLNMRHFDVQLMGGAALHLNKIAEMRTGEGKTLVATLPAYLNGLSGRGVHVVTVNDYLARRDSEWMGQLYRWLGLSTGLIYSHQPDHEKSDAYRADISYGTNHEFGFDYLRDNMRTSLDELVQRPYYFSIVDEVDNILIDEARTPLIISGFPTESFQEIYVKMAEIAPKLEKGKDKDDEDCDYWVDEKGKNVLLTEQGTDKAEKMLGVSTLYDMHYNFAHHLTQALRAKELYKLDTEYVIRPNEEGKPEVTIVDEFTGRMMVGRRWSDGLHQAIEAKERVPIQEETMTYASITYQNLFRLYPKLSGMTGTAMTEAPEFLKIYNLDVVAIPTNRTNQRNDNADVIYKTEMQKFYSVVEEIVEMHELGRPVLVGTTSIEKSEVIDQLLGKPQIMNEYLVRKMQKAVDVMKRHGFQSEATADLLKIFDRPGQIDLAKLEQVCGQLEKDFPKRSEEFLERCYSVLKTAKIVATIRKGIGHNVLNAKHHEREALIVAQAGRKGAVTVATNMAGRGTDILLGGNAEYLAKEKLMREKLEPETPEYEERLKQLAQEMKAETDAEHDEVVKLGGLHIIGTERHEARRIDNQLRGRSARQGDPGSTRFFLSLEDSLMRIFGGEKISRLMDLIRADEEMPIESGMVSRSIEGAQKRVEAHHFDMRKHVLQYDDVLNTQREVIYRERRRILEKADLRGNMSDMLEEHIDIVINTYIDPEAQPEAWEEHGLSDILTKLQNDVPLLSDLKAEELYGLSFDDLRGKLQDAGKLAYEVREQHVGLETMRELERQILLRTIDSKWVDYLHNIDILREGIHLRGYGQRDPLQEYKREAFDMFNQLLRSIQEESIQLLFHAQPAPSEEELPEEFLRQLQAHMDGMQMAIDSSEQMPFEDSPFGSPALHITTTTMDNLDFVNKVAAQPDDVNQELKLEAIDPLEHLGEIPDNAALGNGDKPHAEGDVGGAKQQSDDDASATKLEAIAPLPANGDSATSAGTNGGSDTSSDDTSADKAGAGGSKKSKKKK